MRLLDKRFSGIARGVGTAKILGRVHSAQMKLTDLHLPCSFTIMEGRDVDLLFGLDMLKAHQACIDLERNVLRIKGREVKFLSEHELPENARDPQPLPEELTNPSAPSRNQPASTPSAPSFPGSGQTLGRSPAPGGQPRAAPAPGNPQLEEHITTLVNLGFNREQAIQALESAGGNVDVAASMLFM